MFRKNSNKIGLLADEIKIRPLLTHYLTPAKKRGYVCIGCGNVSGKDGTGAEVTKDGQLFCGKCQKPFSNIDIIANYLGIGTTGKDFLEVIKFGLPFIDSDKTPTTPEKAEKLNQKLKKMNLLTASKRLKIIWHNLLKVKAVFGADYHLKLYSAIIAVFFLTSIFLPQVKNFPLASFPMT